MKSMLRLMALCALLRFSAFAEPIKIGIIGCDTSHVPAFTDLINNANGKNHVAGGKVVAAFKGGSPDIPASAGRVEGYAKTLHEKFGVKIVDNIDDLCRMVDAVLIESVDGRPHLEQARPVFKAGKRVFIDKPLAGSLKDAIEIVKLSKQTKTPFLSSSSYRYYDSLIALKKADVGELKGAISYGPCSLEPHHPDFFWYGIHPTEALFAVMGTGCESVVRVATPDTDAAVGVWKGGKVGEMRGLRNAATPNKVILFGTKTVAQQEAGGDYAPLVREIMTFFQTGIAPVSPEETLEIFAFMEAADESKRQGGKPVRIEDVLKKNGFAE